MTHLALHNKTLKALSFPLSPPPVKPVVDLETEFSLYLQIPTQIQIPDPTSRPSGRVSGHVRTGALRTATGPPNPTPSLVEPTDHC
jgi:hypothetical protein